MVPVFEEIEDAGGVTDVLPPQRHDFAEPAPVRISSITAVITDGSSRSHCRTPQLDAEVQESGTP